MRSHRSISTKSPGESDFEDPEGNGDEDSSESEDSDSSPPVRVTRVTRKPVLSPRRTRRHIPPKRALSQGSDHSFVEDSSDSSSESESDDRTKRKPAPPHRMVRRKPRTYHEYGSVVSFDDFATEARGKDGPLFTHVAVCSKCGTPPTHLERKKGRRRKLDEFEMDGEELAKSKGGWVACVSCCQAIHFGCLSKQARDQMIRRIRQMENAEDSDSSSPGSRRQTLHTLEVGRYLCNGCVNPSPCLGCKEAIPKPQYRNVKDQDDPFLAAAESIPSLDRGGSQSPSNTPPEKAKDGVRPPSPLLFRCVTCRRSAHYEHLAPLQTDEDTQTPPTGLALEYQEFGWQCKDCHSWTLNVDKILAWRPYPADAKEPEYAPGELPPIKDALSRVYLVKWEDRSYRYASLMMSRRISSLLWIHRRVEWVPHLFLVARFRSRLSNFLKKGPSIDLLDYTSHEVQQRIAERLVVTGVPASPTRVAHHTAIDDDALEDDETIRTPAADADADLRIPSAWKLVDRILYVYFWNPKRTQNGKKRQLARQKARRVVSATSEEESDDEDQHTMEAYLRDGIKPDDSLLETWQERGHRMPITESDAGDVVWAYMKWQDLPYEACTCNYYGQASVLLISIHDSYMGHATNRP